MFEFSVEFLELFIAMLQGVNHNSFSIIFFPVNKT